MALSLKLLDLLLDELVGMMDGWIHGKAPLWHLKQ
jgi:hypothetical protein